MAFTKNLQGKPEKKEFEERVLEVSRVSRTVKGGKRLRFRVLAIVGNRNGRVGMGLGKAQEVSPAVAKAVAQAKKHMISVPMKGGTIPFEMNTFFASSRVILRPAAPGTSVIAGGAVRAIMELAGIKNVLSKIIGSTNKVNTAIATFLAFKKIKQYQAISEEKIISAEKQSVKEVKKEISETKKTKKKTEEKISKPVKKTARGKKK